MFNKGIRAAAALTAAVLLCTHAAAFPAKAEEPDVSSASGESVSLSSGTAVSAEEAASEEKEAYSTSVTISVEEEPDAVSEAVSEEETAVTIVQEDDKVYSGIFGCHTEDPYGELIDGLYDETTGSFFLFLPNRADISEYVLCIDGVAVRSASAGSADRESGTVTGAFEQSGDTVFVTDTKGCVYSVTALQSDLPSVTINLDGVTLSEVHDNDKTLKYAGTRILITDGDGNYDVFSETAEFKGRGNTSWIWPDKKAYQIRFDKKMRALGLAKAKKWVLLANAFDDSLLRNQTAMYFAEQLGMVYVPDMLPVDLWINGEYRGTYLIGEKVEIDERRLNLTDELGVLMEQDDAFFRENEFWFEDEFLEKCFGLKDAVSDSDSKTVMKAVDSFHDKLDAFMKYLESNDRDCITLEDLSDYIDVESFAKWLLVNEYLLNVESYFTSFFWYTDGEDDVLHLGPVWDFDSCMGNKQEENNYTNIFGSRHILFNRLLGIPEFAEYIDSLFEENRDIVSSLPEYVRNESGKLHDSAVMNYVRWRCLGEDNSKPDLKPYADTYEAAVEELADWLESRYDFYLTVGNRWFSE